MSDDTVTRVNYFEGQFLRTQDFTDEQAYHVAMRRRHNISHHTWGIVSGLELVQEEGNFFVQPGMAVDGYGRELILPQRQALPSSAFIDKGSKELDVWLVYGLVSSDTPPAGYTGCVERTTTGNGNGNGQSLFYRSQETAQVILERPNQDYPDRREPKGLSVQDRSFDASRTPPDSPQSYWPLYLGQVIDDPANKQGRFAVKLDDRPYVGLVGELINSPSGRAQVQIGAERADDLRRFVVSTRDEPTLTAGGAPAVSEWQPRLDIDAGGQLNIRGDAGVDGNLTMVGGALVFESGTAREDDAPAWNIYHLSSEAPVGSEELRIEMAAAPAANAGSNQVVIGAWFKGPDETGQEKEMFHPYLTIRDDASVVVDGNLVVKGLLTADSISEAKLSDATRNVFSSALMSGILSTSARLPEISRSTGRSALFRSTESGAAETEERVRELATRIASDPRLLTLFAESMKKTHPQEARSLSTALS